MNSKQTDNSQEEKPEDWLPTQVKKKTQLSIPSQEEIDSAISEVLNEKKISTVYTKPTEECNVTVDSVQTELTDATVPKRLSTKQKKASFEEYKETFLHVPKLEDRKPVFISCEVRDRLDDIVRKLGRRRMSVSGFIENLARHHLELYHEDVESWKKL